MTHWVGWRVTARTLFLWLVRVALVRPATRSHSRTVQSWLPEMIWWTKGQSPNKKSLLTFADEHASLNSAKYAVHAMDKRWIYWLWLHRIQQHVYSAVMFSKAGHHRKPFGQHGNTTSRMLYENLLVGKGLCTGVHTNTCFLPEVLLPGTWLRQLCWYVQLVCGCTPSFGCPKPMHKNNILHQQSSFQNLPIRLQFNQ